MKLLLHICCAPCSNMCIETLRLEGIEPQGFWYNPNIHPFTEYRARRNCLREYAKTIGLTLHEQNDYGLRPFVREVAGDIDGRCVKCYEMRLGRTAQFAAEHGFDAFTSSLFVSPYQQHELMRQVAQNAVRGLASGFCTGIFGPTLKLARREPGNWGSICRSTAAVCFPRRNATSSPRRFCGRSIWRCRRKLNNVLFPPMWYN